MSDGSRRRSLLRACRGALAFGLIASAASVCGGGRPLESRLQGTWDVARVAVDLQDQPRWLYRPDDPQLLGRELVIEPSALRLNFAARACAKPVWSPRATTLEALLRDTFSRPPGEGAEAPTPADFELDVPGGQALEAASVRCADGAGSEPDRWRGAWFALLGDDRLLMAFDAVAVLELRRREAGAKPAPSFACAKATADAERAICGSVALASLDRSVAAAYGAAQERRADDLERLRAEQQDWLQQRNVCRADAACLEERMEERISSLVQE